MNTELSPENNITCSKGHDNIANNNSFRLGKKKPQVAMFRAIKQHVTGTYHGKQRHGMNVLNPKNKSPLLTISQKGSEDMMAPM